MPAESHAKRNAASRPCRRREVAGPAMPATARTGPPRPASPGPPAAGWPRPEPVQASARGSGATWLPRPGTRRGRPTATTWPRASAALSPALRPPRPRPSARPSRATSTSRLATTRPWAVSAARQRDVVLGRHAHGAHGDGVERGTRRVAAGLLGEDQRVGLGGADVRVHRPRGAEFYDEW